MGVPTQGGPSRRSIVAGLALGAFAAPTHAASPARSPQPIRFGLTSVFVTDDVVLLGQLRAHLERATGRAVELVTRRTYQEITARLVSAQIAAAWFCSFPFVRFRDRLELVAVPLWRGAPLYQSYLITGRHRSVPSWREREGDVHAFSDPDSNSGWLATAALLAREQAPPPGRFFSRSFFTSVHRNVVRAVGSGLADSGSVDGYVFDVLVETEPELTAAMSVAPESASHGFPPLAGAPVKMRTTLARFRPHGDRHQLKQSLRHLPCGRHRCAGDTSPMLACFADDDLAELTRDGIAQGVRAGPLA